MTDNLGISIGRYEIRARIGRGGMAVVYKAWDTTLDRWVAVKVMHDFLADDADFKARFEREAKFVASLNHPNIVQVYDFGVTERSSGSIYYMVMALIEGQTLRDRMESLANSVTRMPLAEVTRIMRGICGALSYAHGRGMIHRDVKPGNILLNEHGQAILTDFGIARLVAGERLTQSGSTTGTPTYMSPEQGIGEGGDHRADIYSVGVILFEMLAGKPPFEGDSAYAILMKHVSEPPPPLSTLHIDLPPGVEAITARALVKDPSGRYQRIEDMLTDIEARIGGLPALGTVPVQVSPSSALTPRASSTSLPATPPGPRATVIVQTNSYPEVSQRAPGSRDTVTLPRWTVPLGGLALVVVVLFAVVLAIMPRPTSNATTVTVTLAVPPVRTRSFAPAMTAGPFLFEDTFGVARGQFIWPITLDDPHIYRNIEEDVYRIWHTLPATAMTTIFDERNHEYGTGYVFEADVVISPNSQLDSAAGIVFRFRSDDEYYVFAVNGQGQYSIWQRFEGQWTELRGLDTTWTQGEGVNPAGELNRFVLVDSQNRLRGYINGNLLVDLPFRPSIPSGGVGMYLATTSSPISEPYAGIDIERFKVGFFRPPTNTPVPTAVRPTQRPPATQTPDTF